MTEPGQDARVDGNATPLQDENNRVGGEECPNDSLNLTSALGVTTSHGIPISVLHSPMEYSTSAEQETVPSTSNPAEQATVHSISDPVQPGHSSQTPVESSSSVLSQQESSLPINAPEIVGTVSRPGGQDLTLAIHSTLSIADLDQDIPFDQSATSVTSDTAGDTQDMEAESTGPDIPLYIVLRPNLPNRLGAHLPFLSWGGDSLPLDSADYEMSGQWIHNGRVSAGCHASLVEESIAFENGHAVPMNPLFFQHAFRKHIDRWDKIEYKQDYFSTTFHHAIDMYHFKLNSKGLEITYQNHQPDDLSKWEAKYGPYHSSLVKEVRRNREALAAIVQADSLDTGINKAEFEDRCRTVYIQANIKHDIEETHAADFTFGFGSLCTSEAYNIIPRPPPTCANYPTVLLYEWHCNIEPGCYSASKLNHYQFIMHTELPALGLHPYPPNTEDEIFIEDFEDFIIPTPPSIEATSAEIDLNMLYPFVYRW
jgi:hypothetical protein